MKTIPTLETDRLILRPFRLTDSVDVQNLAGDRAIAEMTLAIPHPYELKDAEEWIKNHQMIFEAGKGVDFAIARKSDNALMGAISLMGQTDGHQAELGYWIGKPFWGMGYCTEAAFAIVDFGFKKTGLIRIHSCHFKKNPASGKVMQKLGMVYEGCRRGHILKWGELLDLELYGIMKDDWIRLIHDSN